MINVGVVISSSKPRIVSPLEQIEEAMWLTIKYILNNNERIISFKQMFGIREFEIITDKAKYKGYFMSENIRGIRWNKAFIYGDISDDILEQIYHCISPVDLNDESWNVKDQVVKLH